MDILLDKIIKILGNSENKAGSERIILKNKERKISTEITKDSFLTFEEIDANTKKIAFIDGGNGEVLGGSSFSLQKIRIISSIFLGKDIQKTNYEKFELLCVFNGNFYDFESTQQEYSDAIQKMNLKKSDFTDLGLVSIKSQELCGAIRRLFELNHILKLIEEKTVNIIVIDGSFQGLLPQEKEFIEKIRDESAKKGIVVMGISKSSDISNEEGIPAGLALDLLAKEKGITKNWFTQIGVVENIISGFVKLNKDTKSILRIDFFNDLIDEAKKIELLEILAGASRDPVFLGYPFGLIDADDKARITKEEIEEDQIRLKVLSGKNIDLLERAMATKESHETLDSIRF